MTALDPALFLADLEAKPAALGALAVRLSTDDPWAFVPPIRRVIFLGMGSSRYAAEVAARRLRAAGLDAAAEAWLPSCFELLTSGDGVFPMAPVERISSALQSALMFREGPRVLADGCETGDWSHVDVYLARTMRYRALLFPGSRYDAQALEWLHRRGSTVVAAGGEVPGAAQVIRFRHDHDDHVRLPSETLVAELVAALWWAERRSQGVA